MYVKLVTFKLLVVFVYCNTKNDFIVDYFIYKNAQTIVIFTCNTIEENSSLMKSLSNINVAVAFGLNKRFNIDSLAKTNYRKLGIFIDVRYLDIEYSSSIFANASDNRMFGELHYWVVLDFDLQNILRIIDDRTFSITTDFVVAISSNSTNQYQLFDVFNISKKHGTELNVTFLGVWDKNTGLNISLKQSKFNRRSNLHRLKLKTIFFKLLRKPKNLTLKTYVTNYIHADKESNSKFGFHIIGHLADLYNFTMIPIESGEWEPNDLLGPVVRAMMNDSADLSGTPFTMNIQRTYLVKFVHQDWPFRTCFIFRNPQLNYIKFHQILRPFSSNVWFLMIIFLVLMILVLIVVLRHEKDNFGTTLLSNSLLITFGCLCQQGVSVEIQRLSTHVVILFTLIFGLLMYNYYSACIVSARLAEPIYKINDSLNEMGKLNLKITSEWMSFLEYFLHQSHWDAQTFHSKYWQSIPKSKRFEVPEIAMKLVQKGGYAYHSFPDIMYPFIKEYYDNREICELMEVHLVRPCSIPFSVTVNSSFTEMARVGLSKIAEVGLRQREVLRWSEIKPLCRKDIRSASSIEMNEFAPHLFLLIFGLLISILVCILEIIISHICYPLKLKTNVTSNNDASKRLFSL